MIFNLTEIDNNQIIAPRIEFIDRAHRLVALVSFRCKLENAPDQTEIYCLKSNLIRRGENNPHQILSFITVKTQYIDFCPAQLAAFDFVPTTTRGYFYLESIETGEAIRIEKAALQIKIGKLTSSRAI